MYSVFSCDPSNLPEGYHLAQWQSAFDRYTGTSFEFAGKPDENGEFTEGTTFKYKGKDINVLMYYDYEKTEEGIINITINVLCPENYDGTVFQIGYSDQDINDAFAAIDLTGEPYTIDNLPGFDTNGHEYYYFSFDS